VSSVLRLFNRYFFVPTIVSVVVEGGLLMLAVWLASRLRGWVYYGRLGLDPPPYFDTYFGLRTALFIVVVILALYFNGLYDLGERLSRRQAWIRGARALTIAAAVLLVLYYVTYPFLTIGRGTFAVALTLGALFLLAWRRLLTWFLTSVAFSGRILIIGADDSAVELAREVLARKHLGYSILGFLDDDPKMQGKRLLNPRVIGTTGHVWELARANRATSIVVAGLEKRGRVDMEALLKCKNYGIPVQEGSSFIEQLTGRIPLDTLRISWLVFSEGLVVSPATKILKRITDLLVSLVLLALLAPLMLLAAVLIKLDSRGPILYRQERIGFRGKRFVLCKFRSMTTDAEASGEAQWAQEEDPRVTRVGRLLRRTRIDELPQLWNVLVGEMSLIGPRPEREVFVKQLRKLTPFYDQRHMVRPGITGWAQVMAPYASTVQESLEKLEFDLFYLKNLSFLLDMTIIVSTIRTLLLGRGAR
jgi:sugar transferase (PEP-CTERM system associated)